jgi:hypothetical protein
MKKLLCVLNLSGAMETRDHFKNGANPKNHTIKGIILAAILLIMSSYFVMGQSNTPIIGYDKVAWGATIQEVEQFYPTIIDRGNNPETSISIFKEEVNSNDMRYKYFTFFQGKLYAVDVTYDSKIKEPLIDKLISIYGNFDEFEIQETGVEHRIRRYNKNLTIEVFSGAGGNVVLYSDPIVREKIEKAKKEKAKDDVKL